jgi:hypothetical protein
MNSKPRSKLNIPLNQKKMEQPIHLVHFLIPPNNLNTLKFSMHLQALRKYLHTLKTHKLSESKLTQLK